MPPNPPVSTPSATTASAKSSPALQRFLKWNASPSNPKCLDDLWHGRLAHGVKTMPVFTYNASDQATEIISGTIAADTPRQARDLLRERGLVIRDIKTYHPATHSKSPRWPSRSHRHHTTQFIR